MNDRYTTGIQGEFEPGSNQRVLRNLLGVYDSAEMAEVEVQQLLKLYEDVLIDDFPDRCLTVADLKTWHYRWLGNVFAWAGRERMVNMSRQGFHFTAAAQVPRLLAAFERTHLSPVTPCRADNETRLAEILAVTHVELILVHPFRDGNGRLSRLLADVMAGQAGQPPLDYSAWDTDKKRHFSAIQAGMAHDYAPMTKLMSAALA